MYGLHLMNPGHRMNCDFAAANWLPFLIHLTRRNRVITFFDYREIAKNINFSIPFGKIKRNSENIKAIITEFVCLSEASSQILLTVL